MAVSPRGDCRPPHCLVVGVVGVVGGRRQLHDRTPLVDLLFLEAAPFLFERAFLDGRRAGGDMAKPVLCSVEHELVLSGEEGELRPILADRPAAEPHLPHHLRAGDVLLRRRAQQHLFRVVRLRRGVRVQRVGAAAVGELALVGAVDALDVAA